MSRKSKNKHGDPIRTPIGVYELVLPCAVLAVICLVIVSSFLGLFIIGSLINTATITNNMPDLPLPVLVLIFAATLSCLFCMGVIIRRCVAGIRRYYGVYEKQSAKSMRSTTIDVNKSDSAEIYDSYKATQKQQYH